jgi:hypothetical protein
VFAVDRNCSRTSSNSTRRVLNDTVPPMIAVVSATANP